MDANAFVALDKTSYCKQEENRKKNLETSKKRSPLERKNMYRTQEKFFQDRIKCLHRASDYWNKRLRLF